MTELTFPSTFCLQVYLIDAKLYNTTPPGWRKFQFSGTGLGWYPCKLHVILNVVRCAILCHLYNLENEKNTHGGVLLLVKLQLTTALATLLKETLLHGCFSHFFKIVQMVQNCAKQQQCNNPSLDLTWSTKLSQN